MGVKGLYLIAYNCACCAGWSVVFALAAKTVVNELLVSSSSAEDEGESGNAFLGALASVYNTPMLKEALYYSQTAALLEILHALLKLVRSPVMVTAMQVGSRIVALVAVLNSTMAQRKCGVHV